MPLDARGSSRRDAKMRVSDVPACPGGAPIPPEASWRGRFAQPGLPLAMKLAAPPQQLPATEAGLGISNSRQGKEREVLLHKILRVAHSVAQNAAKTSQNRLNQCTGTYRKLLICLRADSS
jgi:hypothetical protein